MMQRSMLVQPQKTGSGVKLLSDPCIGFVHLYHCSLATVLERSRTCVLFHVLYRLSNTRKLVLLLSIVAFDHRLLVFLVVS